MPKGPKPSMKKPAPEAPAERPLSSPQVVSRTFATWLIAKEAVDRYQQEAQKLRDLLLQQIESQGQVDEKGNYFLPLPEPEPGSYAGADYVGLVRQKRVSLSLDEEKALAILGEKDLLDSCAESWIQVVDVDAAVRLLTDAGLLPPGEVEVRTSLNEDAIRAAFFDRKLTREDFRAIFNEKITWALVPQKS